jgi:DNA-binding GntR family transcriptional regulator
MEKFHYRQLFNNLKNQILAGDYKKGDLLPSENELSNRYAITRVTVRQALAELAKEGYIVRRHGKGSIVNSETRVLGLLTFKGFSEVVKGSNHEVSTQMIKELHEDSWPENFMFGLSEKERELGCLYMKRLRHVDSEPVMLELTWLPNFPEMKKIKEVQLLDGSLFKTLSTLFQVTISNVDQNLWAIKADDEIAFFLNIKKKSPIVYIERKYATSRNDIFVYSKLFCNTDHYALSNQFN